MKLFKWFAAGIGCAAFSYTAYAGVTWVRYGKVNPGKGENADSLLDRFMPRYEIVERHHIRIGAPADIALAAAAEVNLDDNVVIHWIFKGRELILRSDPAAASGPQAFLDEVKSLGWRVLAEQSGREIVLGAVTKPWEANPVFRGVAPDEFLAFQEPGNVKIIWTLRADPDGRGGSVFRTETRAIATDPEARRKFRRYWSFLSPGIILIRWAMLPVVKSEAERRWRDEAA